MIDLRHWDLSLEIRGGGEATYDVNLLKVDILSDNPKVLPG